MKKMQNAGGDSMECEQLMTNMKMIFSEAELKRIECNTVIDGLAYVELDLHGLTYKKAERMVANVICVNRGRFVVKVIHGYNHGTVLKEMIMNETISSRISKRVSPVWNPGQTFLTVAA